MEGFETVCRATAEQRAVSRHAAHCMLFARTDRQGFYEEQARADVLMMLRHDGSIGFPGGFVDAAETWEAALNRELKEEIDLDTDKHCFDVEHYVYSVIDQASGFGLHFYMMELSEDDFKSVEKGVCNGEHFGHETLGIMRVPLNGGPQCKGLPRFLQNQFVGPARIELMKGLIHANILTREEVRLVLEKANLSHLCDAIPV